MYDVDTSKKKLETPTIIQLYSAFPELIRLEISRRDVRYQKYDRHVLLGQGQFLSY